MGNNATDKEQHTDPVDEMLLSEQVLEMVSRMKDVNLVKCGERESCLYHRLMYCGSPSAQESVLPGALVEAEEDKYKRALL